MQLGLFLKGFGLPMEEALLFWRQEFSPRIDSETFDKQYAYNIRFNYGKEGKRADYTPHSCMKVRSPVQEHACRPRACPTSVLHPPPFSSSLGCPCGTETRQLVSRPGGVAMRREAMQ